MRGQLHELVLSFDSDNGQDEQVFAVAVNLVGDLLGGDAGETLSHAMDAADGRFYLKSGTGEQVWKACCEAAAGQADLDPFHPDNLDSSEREDLARQLEKFSPPLED